MRTGGRSHMVQGSLADVLEEADGQPPVEQTLEIAKSVCGALGFVHGQSLIHRDLRPVDIRTPARPTEFLGNRFGDASRSVISATTALHRHTAPQEDDLTVVDYARGTCHMWMVGSGDFRAGEP